MKIKHHYGLAVNLTLLIILAFNTNVHAGKNVPASPLLNPAYAPGNPHRVEGNPPLCGDGVKAGNEECDDGNRLPHDGCDSYCKLEAAAPVCGNGIKEGNEQCDDGNTVSGDGCSSTCRTEQPVKPNKPNKPHRPDRPWWHIFFPNTPEVPSTDVTPTPEGGTTPPVEETPTTPEEPTIPTEPNPNEPGVVECQFECTDTDGGTNPVNHQDSVYGHDALGTAFSRSDVCLDITRVRETICTDTGWTYYDVACPQGTLCENGTCIPHDIETDCTDSDGGSNPITSVGTVDGTDALGNAFSRSDVCFDITRVRETICTDTGWTYYDVACPQGTLCQGGICSPIPGTGPDGTTIDPDHNPGTIGQTDCTDSDGGSNPTTSVGTVDGTDAMGNAFSRSDICAGITTVQETMCTDTGWTYENIRCPEHTVCAGGICIPCDC